jgi:hypothetical protein
MIFRNNHPSDSDTGAIAGRRGTYRRLSSGSPPKYHSIKAVVEALDVSPRAVRRWIARGDLIVHRVDHIVRIAETDLRTFLALHRES